MKISPSAHVVFMQFTLCKLCLSLKKKKETKLKRAKQDLYYLSGFCKTLRSQVQDRDLVEENMQITCRQIYPSILLYIHSSLTSTATSALGAVCELLVMQQGTRPSCSHSVRGDNTQKETIHIIL